MSLQLRFGCDVEGCEMTVCVSIAEWDWDAWLGGNGVVGRSGWIDGHWELPEPWQAIRRNMRESTRVLCPEHARRITDGS